ncbi:type II toxin-antitoxin system VapC family toxin [Massilia terrae]|uniref:Type II toxin-antitoxin system VapC family toxin n=1 Tax=Massilia terrae TaxID=1811224 RepID=A0ABT2CZT6_9BURK|nr:type II toxin-antitoxin system VapC family toxin [Massilia terrae]MCS0659482.1 type II toxin-antitoxin system VapC family toxin [Massilia terrae]
MHLLLDTHVYLWWLGDHAKLNKSAREMIVAASEVYVSSASIWEAAIKISTGKLDVDIDRLVAEVANLGFRELPVSARHAAMVVRLPNIHRDPFDRILIAQALCGPLRFLTADATLRDYSELVEVI